MFHPARILLFLLLLFTVDHSVMGQCTSYPIVDLGPDTSVCATSLLLNAQNAGLNYLWSTSDTTQTISPVSSGTYFVTVTDSNGCATTDSVDVTLNPPAIAGVISISGGDTMLCGNEYAWFYSNGHSGTVLWWVMDTMNWVWMPFHSGDTVDFGYAPNGISGYYQFLITVVNGNCPPDTADIFTVEMHSSPEPVLPNDALVCAGGFTIDAGYSGMNHLWSTGDTTQLLQINNSGTYYVTVTDSTGCFGSDTVNYTIPLPIAVTIGSLPDSVCSSDAALILTGSPSGGVFSGTGVAGSLFSPALAGAGVWPVTYLITDSVGCPFAAEEFVTVLPCVGIQEETTSPLLIFPNPVSDVLNAEIFNGDNVVQVIDSRGRIVMQEFISSNEAFLQINATNLVEGIYTLKITGSNGIRLARFSKL